MCRLRGALCRSRSQQAQVEREDLKMAERVCPDCGARVNDARFCPDCGRPLTGPEGAEQSGTELAAEPPPEPAAQAEESPPPPPAPPADQPGVSADGLEPQGPHQEPEYAGATALQHAAADIQRSRVPADGLRRCPDCGEAVYEGERVCWGCSRRLLPQQEAPPAGVAGGPPIAGGPAVEPGTLQTRAAEPQEPAAPRASDEAMAYAWWSFGLGLLSVFSCGLLGLVGIASIWLGLIAHRRNAGPVAIAGVVAGVIGLLMLLAWAVAMVVMMPRIFPSGPMHI